MLVFLVIGFSHGHVDSPTSPGVPADFAKYTLTATSNDLDEVKAMVAKTKGEIACIILEPIMEAFSPEGGIYQAGTLSTIFT